MQWLEQMSRKLNPRILIVEDNPADAKLIIRALSQGASKIIDVVGDGEEALDFLYRRGKYAQAPRPDLILLDLNLPRVDGRAVLSTVKADDQLRCIPVLVFSTSDDQRDVQNAYELSANCYLVKPSELDHYKDVAQAIDSWFETAMLPT